MSPFKGSPGPLRLDKLVLSARSGAYIVGPVKMETQVSMFKSEEFQDGGCRGLEEAGSLGNDAFQVTCLGSCLCLSALHTIPLLPLSHLPSSDLLFPS